MPFSPRVLALLAEYEDSDDLPRVIVGEAILDHATDDAGAADFARGIITTATAVLHALENQDDADRDPASK